MRYPRASTDPLEIIRVNECDAPLDLATSRFQALWNEIERLTALTSWQPIETAPTDGTKIVVWSKLAKDTAMVVFDGGEWRLFPDGPRLIPNELTHWMPTPAPPVS